MWSPICLNQTHSEGLRKGGRNSWKEHEQCHQNEVLNGGNKESKGQLQEVTTVVKGEELETWFTIKGKSRIREEFSDGQFKGGELEERAAAHYFR